MWYSWWPFTSTHHVIKYSESPYVPHCKLHYVHKKVLKRFRSVRSVTSLAKRKGVEEDDQPMCSEKKKLFVCKQIPLLPGCHYRLWWGVLNTPQNHRLKMIQKYTTANMTFTCCNFPLPNLLTLRVQYFSLRKKKFWTSRESKLPVNFFISNEKNNL